MGVFLQIPRNCAASIEFNDLTLNVKTGFRGAPKEILHGISGIFRPGELTAIMGPSGAGKSTLLNILTGFQNTGMGGSVLLNGRDRRKCHTEFRKQSSYIRQEDCLPPLFTAKELMAQAADLKLGSSFSRKAKHILVEDIMEALGLHTCCSTPCGRMSGGQRKRLAIALELLANPPVMFLDEPTSGLDSSSSMQCLSLLKALARGGRSIVCTIHQPSAVAFLMFDQVYVLADGHCAYRGTAHEVVPHLDKLGYTCPQYHNPADYLLEVVSGEYGDALGRLRDAMEADSCNYPPPAPGKQHVIWSHRSRHSLKRAICVVGEDSSGAPITRPDPPSEWARFPVLLCRLALALHRDWTALYMRIVLHMIIGAILGLTFQGVGNDSSKTVSNLGFLFATGVYLTYTTMAPAIFKFPEEVAIMKNEWFNNWYKLRTYYVASIFVSSPPHMVFCAICCSITYYMTDQPLDVWRFCMFYLVAVINCLTAESIGIGIGSQFIKKPIKALFLGAILLAFWLLFSGFLVLLPHMSEVMRWVADMCFIRYTMEAFMICVFGFDRPRIPCPASETYCHLREPGMLMREFGMTDDRFWVDIGFLVFFYTLSRVGAFINLYRAVKSC